MSYIFYIFIFAKAKLNIRFSYFIFCLNNGKRSFIAHELFVIHLSPNPYPFLLIYGVHKVMALLVCQIWIETKLMNPFLHIVYIKPSVVWTMISILITGWPASGKIRENQGILKSRFQIRESQGKWTFLEKIREKSENFIMNQGKNQGISLYYLFFIFSFFLKNFRSRLRRSHSINKK